MLKCERDVVCMDGVMEIDTDISRVVVEVIYVEA